MSTSLLSHPWSSVERMFGTLERVDEAVRQLAGEDRAGWSGAAHSANVLGLLASIEALPTAARRTIPFTTART